MTATTYDHLLAAVGISPVPTFNTGNHPLRRRQCTWVAHGDGLETANFAGKEMMLLQDEAGYRLTYLDMAYPARFPTPELAKDVAADFAQAVLLTMLQFLSTHSK